jgi:PAS domain S-box-containing protein
MIGTEKLEGTGALRESEARYRALALASADVLYRMSPDWSEMRRLDGRGFLSDTVEPSAAWLGRYIHPDDQQMVTAAIQDAVREKRMFALEHRVVRADGTLGWTSSRAVPLLDANGEIIEWVGAATDVTTRKESEDALRASAVRLEKELSCAELLQRLSLRLIPEEHPETLHEEILEAAMELMDSDVASLHVLEPNHQRLRLVATRNMHPESQAHWRYVGAGHASTCGQFFRTDGRVIVEDVEKDAAMAGSRDLEEYRRSNIRAVQTTPLVSRSGRRLGAMSTHWRQPRKLSEHDFRFFDILARQLADLMERSQTDAALRESETNYRTLFESIDEGFCVVEVIFDNDNRPINYRFLEVNPAFIQQTGLNNAIGRSMRELAPAHEDSWYEIYGRVALTGNAIRFEAPAEALGRWYDVYALRVGEPAAHRVAILFNDISARKRADAELQSTQKRLNEALATAHMSYWQRDPDTGHTITSPSMDDVFGLRPGERFRGDGQAFALVHREDRNQYQDLVERAGSREEGWHAEFRIVRPRDGEIAWLEEVATVARDPETGRRRVTGLVRDITDRKRSEAVAALERASRDRDAVRRQLLEAEEGERRRLARDLHDETGQHLTALGLGLQALSNIAPAGSEVDRRAADLRELANAMGQQLHAVAVRLRPKSLDDFGLEAALGGYAEEWFRKTGIPVDVHARADAERLPSVMESGLYRVVQEALTNVSRHSKATRVSVVVERRDGHVVAIVEDDGQGFDPDGHVGGFGLLGMRERVALLGGTVEIESAPGAGTTIFARIPVNAWSSGENGGER